jgi:hypothetical protein
MHSTQLRRLRTRLLVAENADLEALKQMGMVFNILLQVLNEGRMMEEAGAPGGFCCVCETHE